MHIFVPFGCVSNVALCRDVFFQGVSTSSSGLLLGPEETESATWSKNCVKQLGLSEDFDWVI